MPPNFNYYRPKDFYEKSLQGMVIMLCTVAVAIGVQKIADSLKDEEHESIFLIRVLFPVVFLFGCAFVSFGVVAAALIKKRSARIISGIVMLAVGITLLFVGFYYGR